MTLKEIIDKIKKSGQVEYTEEEMSGYMKKVKNSLLSYTPEAETEWLSIYYDFDKRLIVYYMDREKEDITILKTEEMPEWLRDISMSRWD